MSNTLDRPLTKKKTLVNLSAFSFLFSEFIQHSQNHTNNLEPRLTDLGWNVGVRLYEVLLYREKGTKREIRLISLLSFIQNSVWKALFGKQADSLERSIDHALDYMIVDYAPIVNKYISVPNDAGQLNCASFVAGIVKGILDSADFNPDSVTAHYVKEQGRDLPKTIILIKFSEPPKTL
eukprot:TRINITY_DN908_c2_g2_i1.p1 TRINITY_DN908_c2_g2~~TRINITY_DN908_c2_g2_i1.p1  ORF type:complete len:179 (+),score=33.82 TRINITY_DN908_c2_g2_i1:176-712(+)